MTGTHHSGVHAVSGLQKMTACREGTGHGERLTTLFISMWMWVMHWLRSLDNHQNRTTHAECND